MIHQTGKKLERKPELERIPRACSQPRAQSRSPSRSQQLLAFPAPHMFSYYNLFPTDVPGVPERSQRSQFTARMHSNAGRTRIKIQTIQQQKNSSCNSTCTSPCTNTCNSKSPLFTRCYATSTKTLQSSSQPPGPPSGLQQSEAA